jgi:hypothetical protein
VSTLIVAGLIGVAVLAVMVAACWLIGCVGDYLRAPAIPGPPGGCPWCRPLGLHVGGTLDPRDCTCPEECGLIYCGRHPVTRD